MAKKQMTVSEAGSRGGHARAALYGKRQLSQWARQGGRPRKLDDAALTRLREMLAQGKSHAEISKRLGVSLRTIGRFVARIPEIDNATAS